MEKDVPQLVSKEVREGVERLTRDRVAVSACLVTDAHMSFAP